MATTTWQIEAANRAGTKLASMMDDPRIVEAVRQRCEEASTPFRPGNLPWSYRNLFGVIAARDDFRTTPTESGAIRAAQRESHKQMVCERIAAEILNGLGIAY